MALYVYGIVAAPAYRQAPKTVGVAGADVEIHEDGSLAALVSDVPEVGFRAGRDDLMAHSDVLQEAASSADVLPMRFGTLFASTEELSSAFLRPNEEELCRLLDRLNGALEVQVKGEYVEEAVAREIVSSDRTVQKLQARAKARGNVESKIELGRRFAAALDQRRYADGRRIVDALAPHAQDVAVGDAPGEYGVVNASFLVDREHVDGFRAAFEKLAHESGDRMRLRSLGPMPAYSFVDAGSMAVG